MSGLPLSAFASDRATRYVAAWLVAIGVMAASLTNAWFSFDNTSNDARNDGNSGHTTIDFGGQWLMGRMLVEGYGQHLYDRSYQRRVLLRAYPIEDEVPADQRRRRTRINMTQQTLWTGSWGMTM